MTKARTDTNANSADAGAEQARPKPQPKPPAKPDKGGYYWGTGRRKSSVARVRIKPGDGKLLVNKKQLSDYFAREQDRKAVLAPLKAVEGEKSFDVFVNVRGGGTTGQSGAARLGIGRALKKYDENYIQPLRDGGHLTRDSRMVERKKYGQRGARRRFQFSKR
ncbi:MAG: 30S ribosomal protein S9 [Planctomycetota bacterium]|nr:MAG: 30S ribosomal protein S9 [Planctomycetota bacterium]